MRQPLSDHVQEAPPLLPGNRRLVRTRVAELLLLEGPTVQCIVD